MLGLPQLQAEDMELMEKALDELLRKSEATAALVIDKGGPLVTERGDLILFDTTTLAALAAGTFSATEAMAERIGEKNFSNIYQQGDKRSVLVSSIDDNLLLILIFRADSGVGVMKYYAKSTIESIAKQLVKARDRSPSETVDLVSLNTLDSTQVFRKQAVPT